MDEPHPPSDPLYRIGSQVHDHEARIRLLERDSAVMSESVRQTRETLRGIEGGLQNLQIDLHGRLAALDDKLDTHTAKEDRDRTRLLSMTLGQFLAVLVGIVLILVERGA